MAPPPPPTPTPTLTNLSGDITAEILLRIPPAEPAHLFRAALVCKPWLRILCDPGFLRHYRAFHGAPPLLGLLHRLQVLDGKPAHRFASTTLMPDFPYPGERALDCRHGRVLVHMMDGRRPGHLLVWDPVTGDRHTVPDPDIDWLIYTAAVLCAADGCDHLDCHGGPFRVVFLATLDRENLVKGSLYSSVTGVWTAPVSLDQRCDFYAQYRRDAIAKHGYCLPYVQPRRVAVIGDEIYFTLSRSSAVAKYDCAKNCLSVIDPPPPHPEVYHTMIALTVMDGSSLGAAGIEGSILHVWSRKVKGAAEWVQSRVIDLDKTMPIAKPPDGHGAHVVGFAEGVDIIFIMTDVGLFTFELKSGHVKKVGEPGVYYSILPYMSFYFPDRGRFLSLASGEAH